MSPSTKQALFSIVALIFLLSACVPAQPTQRPEDVANQVATSVALTVAAQNAQTQSAESPTPVATNTTLPTQTSEVPASPTPIPPTVTAVTVLPPTAVSGGGGGTTTKPEYACNPFPRTPRDNTVFRPNDPFDISWTIVNTGTKTMIAGLDLKYDDGPQMTNTTLVELPELEPGDQVVVRMDAVAPSEEGTHIMTFSVEGSLCFPYVAIIVER
jgi:Ig-like domain-containing protein